MKYLIFLFLFLFLILFSFSCSQESLDASATTYKREMAKDRDYETEDAEPWEFDYKSIDTTSMDIPVSEENYMKEGDINYVLKDTMILGVTNEVNMTISKNVDKEILIKDIPTFNENNLNTETIRIATSMKARLIDPTGINFKIISRTNEEQFLEENDYTRWIWDVTPLTKGNNKLSLIVDIVINDKSKSINVHDGEIYVYSDENFFQKIISFLNMNWQFVISTLLIPLFIFLYKKYKENNKMKKIHNNLY